MITNKLIEVGTEVKETRSNVRIKNTFDSKPKWQRASMMFAVPLANFLLSIFILSIIFLNTPDPQSVTVIKDQNSSIIIKSDSELILPGDQIKSINSVKINDPKDINLELLSYAGYSGYIDLGLKRNDINNLVNVSIQVTDYLRPQRALCQCREPQSPRHRPCRQYSTTRRPRCECHGVSHTTPATWGLSTRGT